jgi:hypothetical protein
MNKCKFCDKSFSTKTNLTYHQKTAKYCLKKQNVSSDKFQCEECLKYFSNKSNFERHKESCEYNTVKPYKEKIKILENENIMCKEQNKKQEELIKKQEEQIKELQNKIENIALKAVEKPININNQRINNNQKINQVINNLIPITDNYIKEQVPNLTIEHIKKGPIGYAEYILNYPLNKRILCVDYSRKKIKYKDENGNIITDPEMALLSVKLFESIKERNKNLICEYIEKLSVDSETKMKIVYDMYNYMSMIDRGSVGDKSELYPELTRNLCSQILI